MFFKTSDPQYFFDELLSSAVCIEHTDTEVGSFIQATSIYLHVCAQRYISPHVCTDTINKRRAMLKTTSVRTYVD